MADEPQLDKRRRQNRDSQRRFRKEMLRTSYREANQE
jgi:hypothetical protein